MRLSMQFQCSVLATFLILSICHAAAAQSSAAATQPAPDAIGQELATAKTRHQQEINDARKALLDVISRRISEATDAGDLAMVQALQVAKGTAAVDGTVSDSIKDPVVLVAKNNYETTVAAARARLNRAYQKAVRDYTRAQQLDKAQSTQDELNSLELTDPTMTPHVIDLLRLVDPARDALAGRWYLADGNLSNESSSCAQIRFPYKPPPEYDYHLVYDRSKADWGLDLGVCRLDAGIFKCGMPCRKFPDVNIVGLRGLEAIRYRAPAHAITHCDVCIQVRNDRLTVIVNGEKSIDQPIVSWEFSKTPEWLRGPKRFGLSVTDWWGRTTITKAEVTEISGFGEVLGRAAPH